jgi:hypothetical protein
MFQFIFKVILNVVFVFQKHRTFKNIIFFYIFLNNCDILILKKYFFKIISKNTFVVVFQIAFYLEIY